MAADAGAQQILDLLNQSSSQLYEDAVAFSRASMKAPERPYGVMPQYGVDALASMRAFFREVRREIDAIETVDVTSKAGAIKALDKIDRQFDAYESGLELGLSNEAMPKLKKSKQVGKEAAAGLRRAIAGLSR
jgi:hypothetical protein